MKIKVKGYLSIKKAMGNRSPIEMKIEGATLRDVLNELREKFGKDLGNLLYDDETKEVSPNILVFVNGRHYSFLPKQMDTELKDDDEVSIFPPVAGG